MILMKVGLFVLVKICSLILRFIFVNQTIFAFITIFRLNFCRIRRFFNPLNIFFWGNARKIFECVNKMTLIVKIIFPGKRQKRINFFAVHFVYDCVHFYFITELFCAAPQIRFKQKIYIPRRIAR